ncbi:hypothetical protein [Jeotgalibacillus soli]|uniref:Abortive phage infection protein n=1 Tax=Jeotgalibacillus soli TaxID=889306 RepID=A0A0C2VPE5_9BACL|nr:hypothetical protein [Jeotgalibacillus soli]KIL45883.1 hypothetical protein KP78_22320 [Jeotgalibacillus soli]
MNKEEMIEMLNELKEKKIEQLFISKEDFPVCRELILARDDFKHFRGIAQRNGDIIYHYMNEPRS